MANRWLAVTWAGGGNVGPLLALAGYLAGRGHRLAALASPSLETRLTDAGLTPVEMSAGWLPSADEVLSAADRLQPEALIIDYMLTDALCGAAFTGLPTVALVHTLYRALLVDDAPAPMAMAGGVEQVNKTRSRLALTTISSLGALLTEARLVLVSAPETMDVLGPTPENLRYTGLLVESAPPPAQLITPPGTDPLVVVSLGTAMSGGVEGELSLLQKILQVLSTLPVRAVVNLPDYISAASLDASANVVLAGYIPHAQLLVGAALLVTHAGLGSICAALAADVPMVCLPLDRDQPANAEAAARIGAGLYLAPECTADELASALIQGLHWKSRVRFKADPAAAVDAMEALLQP